MKKSFFALFALSTLISGAFAASTGSNDTPLGQLDIYSIEIKLLKPVELVGPEYFFPVAANSPLRCRVELYDDVNPSNRFVLSNQGRDFVYFAVNSEGDSDFNVSASMTPDNSHHPHNETVGNTIEFSGGDGNGTGEAGIVSGLSCYGTYITVLGSPNTEKLTTVEAIKQGFGPDVRVTVTHAQPPVY